MQNQTNEEECFLVVQDAVFSPTGKGNWVATNPRTRTHIELNSRAIQAMGACAQGATRNHWLDALSDGEGRRRTYFNHEQGLLVDPTCLGSKDMPWISGIELWKELCQSFLVVESQSYRNFIDTKKSLLDEAHLGSFHQKMGQYLLRDLRVKDTWRWWHDQKFSQDGLTLKEGLYRWIQGHFFDEYFGKQNLSGKHLLDFACGNGFYSGKFADLGAHVTGIDTSKELIDIAKRNHGSKATFLNPETPVQCLEILTSLPQHSYDHIYVCDTLLFFFHDRITHAFQPTELKALLNQFRRLLKNDGKLWILEPNGIFWLSGWYGSASMPYTIVTEYRNQVYHVSPTPDRVVHELGQAGFAVVDMSHPKIDPLASKTDPRAYGFASSFPIWDFYTAITRICDSK